MKSVRVVSFIGLLTHVMCFVFFAVAMNFFDKPAFCTSILAVALILLVTSHVLIASLHCTHCGKKLVIEGFPSYNAFANFFLWTGAEVRCAQCHEKV
jgi:hypothetical protein